MVWNSFLIAPLLAALVGVGMPSQAAAAEFGVDKSHTSVTFRVRHLFTSVEGRFKSFDGSVSFDPTDPASTKVAGWVDAASIDTNHEKRDKHLRSEDFFHTDAHPKITFESTKVTDLDPTKKSGKLHGKLTMRGVTKDIVLDVAFLGEGMDPYGNRKAGFTAETKINRKDFGLNWNEALETGGVLVGEEVTIRIDAEGNAS